MVDLVDSNILVSGAKGLELSALFHAMFPEPASLRRVGGVADQILAHDLVPVIDGNRPGVESARQRRQRLASSSVEPEIGQIVVEGLTEAEADHPSFLAEGIRRIMRQTRQRSIGTILYFVSFASALVTVSARARKASPKQLRVIVIILPVCIVFPFEF